MKKNTEKRNIKITLDVKSVESFLLTRTTNRRKIIGFFYIRKHLVFHLK